MMKRRFKRVMNYLFNFDSLKTPKKKSRKASHAASGSHEHLESESQYVIKKLNESVTPRENISFSRYTPLPRIGEAADDTEQQQSVAAAPASHFITYELSPVKVRHPVPVKLSHQLTPISKVSELPKTKSHHAMSRLIRQDTYTVTDPVVIKGDLLMFLKTQDNMVTTRVGRPNQKVEKSRSTSKRNPIVAEPDTKPKHNVVRASNSRQRLNEVKAKFKQQQEDIKGKEGQGGFWLEL